MPNSRFALHGFAPSLIHGLCAIFASNSRFVRLFQALLAPVSTDLSKGPSTERPAHYFGFIFKYVFLFFPLAIRCTIKPS